MPHDYGASVRLPAADAGPFRSLLMPVGHDAKYFDKDFG